MEYRITDARNEHLPQIAVLEKVCFSSPWTEEQLRGQLKDSMHEFLIAEDSGGAVLGYVGMMYVLDEGYISNVACAPEARRRGIGDALIDRLGELAEEHALAFVTLEVRESNLPAQALYEKHGYRPVGRRKGYYTLPKEDAILMTMFLNRGAEFENTIH